MDRGWNERLNRLVRGEPVVLYHGTTATFNRFDPKRTRKDLVESFYGPGIFLTPSRSVAAAYAHANRNIGVDPRIIRDLTRVDRAAGAFLAALVQQGDIAWETHDWSRVPEHMLQAVGEVAAYVVGSKVEPDLIEDGYFDSIFDTSTGAPDAVYDWIDDLGVDSGIFRPKVYSVRTQIQRPLVTDSQAAARTARQHGYDSVIYDGPQLVNDVPEVAVYDPHRVQIVGVTAV